MDTKQKVKEIVENHTLMCMATVDGNGLPKARSVNFAVGNDESVLYFITYKTTNKVNELKKNNNVYIVINNEGKTMQELANLKYLKASGKAYLCDTPEEAQKAFGLIMQRFPHLKDLPGDPSDFLAFKVELDKVTVTDNTVHFGFMEEVSYR